MHAIYHDNPGRPFFWHHRIRPAAHPVEADAGTMLGDFDGIVLTGSTNVSVTIGEPASVSAEPGATDCARRIADGKLIVDSGSKSSHLTVTVPHLHSLRVDGTGNVTLAGLRDSISIVANGPGNVKASGSVDSVELVVTGPGNFEFSALTAKDAKIVLMGPGNAAVSVARNLNATIIGSGTIRYLGDPQVTQNVLGAGSIGKLPAAI
jgi:hypothetical protein